jgi:hypothetical protein
LALRLKFKLWEKLRWNLSMDSYLYLTTFRKIEDYICKKKEFEISKLW